MSKRTVVQEFIRRWWWIAAPFWRSEHRFRAGKLLVLAMACNIGNIYMTVRLNAWSRDFFNALEDKNATEFWHQLGLLFVLAGISLFLYANQRFWSGKAILIWRGWLSDYYTKRWLDTKHHYRELLIRHIDNPDQRIAEDLRLLPSLTVSMIFDFVDSFGSFGAFVIILWNLSQAYEVAGVVIPGLMLWLALAFVFVGTLLADRVGRPLIDLERRTQEVEADYRSALIRIRDKAKGMAVYDGGNWESATASRQFYNVFTVGIRYLVKQRHLNYFNFSYGQVSGIVPYLLAAPKYFAGAFHMGELMQTVSAFNGVRVSLSWFILNYRSLAEWKAVVDRLTEFDSLLRAKREQSRMIVRSGAEWDLKKLTLWLPDGEVLLKNINLKLRAGERVALVGSSGLGKSTVFYLLAGLWPYAEGELIKPAGRALFLAQETYLPKGSIEEALGYPTLRCLSDEQLRMILCKVELSHLFSCAREIKNWETVLSPGEQQRLVLGRIWVQKPDWLFVDEGWSAVDPSCRSRILARIREDFPDLGVLAIEHHGSRDEFYDRVESWS